MDAILGVLDVLVPPPGGEIEDVEGNRYQIPRSLSARSMVALLRDTDELVGNLRDTIVGGGGAAGMLGRALALLGDDATVKWLDQAFASALPDVYEQACEKLGPQAPTELFALEEIGAGLLPFFGRMIQRLLGSAQEMAEEITNH